MEKVYLLPIPGSEGRKQIVFPSKDLAELYKARHGLDLQVVQINMNATQFLNVYKDDLTKKVVITDDYDNKYSLDDVAPEYMHKISRALKHEVSSAESLFEVEDDILDEEYDD